MKSYQCFSLNKFMNNKIALESLSMDLLRVAVGLNRGSIKMAETFQKEALKRKSEVQVNLLKPYMQKILSNIGNLPKNNEGKAELALMYSTLIRNYCTHFLTRDKD